MGFSSVDAKYDYLIKSQDAKFKATYPTLESYIDSLKKESVYTFGKNTSDAIKASVKGYALEKEAEKQQAEADYYAAVSNMGDSNYEKYKARTGLQTSFNLHGEESSKYKESYKKFELTSRFASDSETNWKIAMDRFNNANRSAHRAFLTSTLT